MNRTVPAHLFPQWQEDHSTPIPAPGPSEDDVAMVTIVAQPCALHEERIATVGGDKWRETCRQNGWRIEGILPDDFEWYGLDMFGPDRCWADKMLHEAFLVSVPPEDAERALAMMSEHDFDVAYAIAA